MRMIAKQQVTDRLAWQQTFVTTCLAVITACSADEPHIQVDPTTVLDEFYAYDGAEDTLMDPLIVAGTAARGQPKGSDVATITVHHDGGQP